MNKDRWFITYFHYRDNSWRAYDPPNKQEWIIHDPVKLGTKRDSKGAWVSEREFEILKIKPCEEKV